MTPISFGVANIMLYMVLVVAQLLIERKLKMDMLLEVPFSFIMGYILDLYQIIIPASPESLGLRIVILLAGNICIAFGVYTMVQSHLVLAPVDGVILIISNHYNKAYSLCKNRSASGKCWSSRAWWRSDKIGIFSGQGFAR